IQKNGHPHKMIFKIKRNIYFLRFKSHDTKSNGIAPVSNNRKYAIRISYQPAITSHNTNRYARNLQKAVRRHDDTGYFHERILIILLLLRHRKNRKENKSQYDYK